MKMAVDSLFNRLGQRAKYQNKDVLILVFAADDVGEVGFMNTLSPTTIIKVRVEDAPNLAMGDSFEIEKACYHLIAEPKKEQHLLVWKAEVSCD